jgi:hypothetical protein
MAFGKRLRDRVVNGQIASGIRIWTGPLGKIGSRRSRGEGQIEIEFSLPIDLAAITAELARESGLDVAIDLLKVAKHGKSDNVYPARFQSFALLRKRRLAATAELVRE